MEFNEKLQELRKQKILTQEELAAELFVSRTAISKWESGRGFPNLESLKALSRYFDVSLDDLLSGEELFTLAVEENDRRESHLRDMLYGLLDCSLLLLLFLPAFGQAGNGDMQSVSLLALSAVQPFLRILYWVAVMGHVFFGVLTLALQNCRAAWWLKGKRLFSLLLGIFAITLFIVSRQPYPAALVLVFLIIKTLTRNVSHR